MGGDDLLRDKLRDLALRVANGLLSQKAELRDQIEGLKVLSGFYAQVARVDRDRLPANRWGSLAARVNGEEMIDGEASQD